MGDAPTNKTAEWIHNAVTKNPFVLLDDGNIRTCPVRFGFPHVFTPQEAMDDGGKPKFSLTALIPASADLTVPKKALVDCGQAKWPGGKFEEFLKDPGFNKPIKDQADKAKFQGFVEGQMYFTASGERRPIIQSQTGALILEEENKVYPGAWGFMIVNPFAWERRNKQGVVVKRGVSFGLNALMVICDDIAFGGNQVDLAKAFAGVDIDASADPSGLFAGPTGGAKASSAADLL
jgi:hypothetical protein